MPQPSVVIAQEDLTSFEIVMQQRRFNAANARQAMIAQGIIKVGQTTQLGSHQARNEIPAELERAYHLSITPGSNSKKHGFIKMREIKANQVGSLINVKGIVTKCTAVVPCIQVAEYACDACGFEVY